KLATNHYATLPTSSLPGVFLPMQKNNKFFYYLAEALYQHLSAYVDTIVEPVASVLMPKSTEMQQ
ncbi:MAG TPA: hypothetical protein VFV49_13200, partial [Thermoanaerobaculia bacterium]|nr:hypothetical protein [Thermoanaerobaculia bacterium]